MVLFLRHTLVQISRFLVVIFCIYKRCTALDEVAKSQKGFPITF